MSLYPWYFYKYEIVVVQLPSCVQFFVTHGQQHTRPPCLHHLPEFAQVHIHCISNLFTCNYEITLEKEMATHTSILAWRIPWVEEPGRLQSMGLQRVGHFTLWICVCFFPWKYNFAFMWFKKYFMMLFFIFFLGKS